MESSAIYKWVRTISNKIFPVLFYCLALASCSSDTTPTMPTQSWSGIQFMVETRPPKLITGMNEFIIIANKEPKGRPASNLIVSLRINEQGKWIQAIQDGKVGAYRRAMSVQDLKKDSLFVRIEYDDRQNILQFPLIQQRVVSTTPE